MIDMKEWVAEAIDRKEVTALPIMTHPGIEMNGETVSRAVRDGSIHAEAVETLSRRYPIVAVTTIMDFTTETEAFGAAILVKLFRQTRYV